MTGHRSFKELTEGFSPERKARVTRLHEARERSQKDLARELNVRQPGEFGTSSD